MDERSLTIILRLIHILAGIFWVGAAILLAGFLVPAMQATGREGGRFIQYLMQQRKLPVFIGVAMGLTILSGLAMYIRMSAATHGAWARSAPGMAYGVGAVAAIIAAFTGSMISGAAGRRMVALAPTIGPAGPTPEQQAEMGRLQGRIALGNRIVSVLLVVAASAMAVARYL